MHPYGSMDEDFYVDRNEFLKYIDYDFYYAHISNNGEGDPHKDGYGYYGLQSIKHSLDDTSPTSSSYLCNLGIQRRRTTAIRIKSQGSNLRMPTRCDSTDTNLRAKLNTPIVLQGVWFK